MNLRTLPAPSLPCPVLPRWQIVRRDDGRVVYHLRASTAVVAWQKFCAVAGGTRAPCHRDYRILSSPSGPES
jgi:hypothetical protein